MRDNLLKPCKTNVNNDISNDFCRRSDRVNAIEFNPTIINYQANRMNCCLQLLSIVIIIK